MAVAHPTSSRAKTRVLYFDIDGTVVHETFGACKEALADGRLEHLIRAAGFERLVCVSDAVSIARLLPSNAHDTVFEFCRGAFEDRAWFREHVRLVPDPVQRARYLDTNDDWYFMDDYAYTYLRKAERSRLAFRGAIKRRVLRAQSRSDGSEVDSWLTALATTRPAVRPASTDLSAFRRPRRSTPLVPQRPVAPAFA